MRTKPTIVVFFLLCTRLATAQPMACNFRHLTTADGVSDDIIRSMAQDKYGYLWIGTGNGLTVYNGHEYKVVEAGEIAPTHLRTTTITALCKDAKGVMWLGMSSGLYCYDYATGHFLSQPGTELLRIAKIYAGGDGLLYLLTGAGLKIYNGNTQKLQAAFRDGLTRQLMATGIHDVCSLNKETLCFAADTGLVVYHVPQQKAELLAAAAPLKNLSQIAAGAKGLVWCSSGATLYRINGKEVKTFLQFSKDGPTNSDNAVNDLLVDGRNRLWAVTSRGGLGLYQEGADSFVSFRHDPLQPQSLSANLGNIIFESSDGNLWIGTEGYGLSYFNPTQSFFRALTPSQRLPTLPDLWCRAAAEDKQGRWWIGTANGAVLYHPQTDGYQVFQNKNGGRKLLYSNSVRTLLCTGDGTVWIGTAEGLNHYRPQTGRMEFLDKKEGMPQTFVWHLAEDRERRIWAACRDGIYTYNPTANRFDDNGTGPLQAFSRLRCRTLFIDAQSRIWFGFDGDGLACYDEKSGRVEQWKKREGDTASLSNDYVTSITQDKEGVIWISTVSGLNRYNAGTGTFQRYTTANGLPSARLSSLMVDDANRLWIGCSKGLCLMDKSRSRVQTFDEEDGLAAAPFNDQSGYRLHNGMFLLPTVKGLLYFDPEAYQQQAFAAATYLAAFRVYNQPFPLSTNPEAVKAITLKWDQSFFSFTVASPDYLHAAQTTYAYWLEGFDKDWIYTKERTRNYTNVPGGDYTLHIKSTADIQFWNVPETTIAVHVGTVFYKRGWFALLAAWLLCGAVYALYRYRLRQQGRLLALQAKAMALEKEKTLALYESLRQQLNPHFLFNSLSSLNGLIRKDGAAASAFLDRLSKIYRYILASRDTEAVRISEDLKLAQTYVQLQQTRFGNGLQLRVAVDEETANKKIAPVTIQNLIENAIKHNVIDAETPLLIAVSADEDYLTVQNNRQKKKVVEGSNRQGLQSMNTLYRYLSGRSVVIEETETTFTVKIPFV